MVVGGGVQCYLAAASLRTDEVSRHKFHRYHLHQRAIKLIYYKYSSRVFTARILGPATSFKVSTCRCSGSVSVGQTEGKQGKKRREGERYDGSHRERGVRVRVRVRVGRKWEGPGEGGKLGKHGSQTWWFNCVLGDEDNMGEVLGYFPLSLFQVPENTSAGEIPASAADDTFFHQLRSSHQQLQHRDGRWLNTMHHSSRMSLWLKL